MVTSQIGSLWVEDPGNLGAAILVCWISNLKCQMYFEEIWNQCLIVNNHNYSISVSSLKISQPLLPEKTNRVSTVPSPDCAIACYSSSAGTSQQTHQVRFLLLSPSQKACERNTRMWVSSTLNPCWSKSMFWPDTGYSVEELCEIQ